MDKLLGIAVLAGLCIMLYGAYLVVNDKQEEWDESNKDM